MEKLSQTRSAFAEGAERLGQMASEVKAQQITEVQGPLPQSPPITAIGPDEMWAKKYMTQGIGTQPDIIGVSGMTPMPHATFVMTDLAPRPVMPKATDAIKPALKPVAPETTAPMNMRFGRKEERPKRSWLGRLIRGG